MALLQHSRQEEMSSTEWLLDNRAKFDAFVYLSRAKALREAQVRSADKELRAYTASCVPEIPEPLRGGKHAVLFRHIATPNFEIRRFLTRAAAFTGFKPVILEYTSDLFTNLNEWKYSLGRIRYHKGFTKRKEQIHESESIIDFNTANKKPLSSIRTRWDQPLVAFHHEMFERELPEEAGCYADLSSWIHRAGTHPQEYYKAFLSLFLQDAILFENFMRDGKERPFTRDVILPVLQEIRTECGHRPMVVALEPTNSEQHTFWLSHPYATKEFIRTKRLKKGE